MTCYKPITGWRGQGGKVTFNRKDAFIDLPPQTVPCGQCIGCRLERSRQWAMRCLHEAQLYDENCFITLTYDEESCPDDYSLDKSHLQKFLKRLRKKYAPKKIKFYACGEYGEKLQRPHYHLCIFNHDFEDKQLWSNKGGNPTYVSQQLMELWPFGNSLIGSVTFDSAAYVARYIMKKITNESVDDVTYWRGTWESGECWKVEKEFNTMSRGGRKGKGLSYDWYEKYKSDVYPSDNIHVNGHAVKPPKYYDTLFQLEDPETMKKLKAARIRKAHKNRADNSQQRLAVREAVKLAQLNKLSRKVE